MGSEKDEKGFYRCLCDPNFAVELPQNAPNACPELLELLGGMLRAQPSDRISMPEVLAHPFFQKDYAAQAPDLKACQPRMRRWSMATVGHPGGLGCARGGA